MTIKKRLTPIDLTMGSLFVALMAVGANITSILPFMMVGGVPITLQTFFAVLAGLILGSRVGPLAMFTYVLLGLAGSPVFAQFKGGTAILLSPTFGFLLSYILLTYIIGKMVEKKRTIPSYITAAVVALAINYIFGTNWMYAAYVLWFEAPKGFTYQMAWYWMAVPFPKDLVLSVLAGVLAYRLEKNVLRKSVFRNQKKMA